MTKIFITGATGYIGGDALHVIVDKHPDYSITCLVRDSNKGAQVARQFAAVRLAYGDLDSIDLIEKESRDADIVCHFAHADHEASAKAIVRGLGARESSAPGFLIHTSGTGILAYDDNVAKTYGNAREKIYDDLEGVGELTSFPDEAAHRNVDKIVLEAGTKFADRIKTAIVAPPCIYGRGRGPSNQRSMQIPELCRATLQQGQAVQVGAGKSMWNSVHVGDLSQVYLRLVEEAAAGGSTAEWAGKPPTWGADGYYFAESDEHVWGAAAQWVADAAADRGYIDSREVKSISADEANALTHFGATLWGSNSRSRARRARELFKWQPGGPSLRDEIAPTLELEAQALGLKRGHAQVAAGDA